MKISEMIDILKFDDIPFMQYPGGYNQKGLLTIDATKEGVVYWKDATINYVSVDDDCKDYVYSTCSELKRHFNRLYNNERELIKYLAICELLSAINKYKSGNRQICFNEVKRYVNELNEHIYTSLQFEQVSHMKNLIDIIRKDELYRELCFNVHEIKSKKADQFTRFKKEENYYRFGNVKYYEILDVVQITVYNDCVELLMKAESTGIPVKRQLDMNKEHSLEGKLLTIIDAWRNKNGY